jgi:hypothetical protein
VHRFGSQVGPQLGLQARAARSAKACASWPEIRSATGPARISASPCSKTLPTGSQRLKTHGHTTPLEEIAALPLPQLPHN